MKFAIQAAKLLVVAVVSTLVGVAIDKVQAKIIPSA